ncbi:MAG: 3-hydroxybutyryl-CoA dehydrogenase [Gemmatimonadota bacterium]|nr:MAG: 3-hydroxybutyryl-CoA dehydrogenase [Gemmatimonadota bacterium]
MEIKKVGVIGCGLMGSGITQVSAQCGYDVVVCEADQELLDKGLKKIDSFLTKGIERGKMTEEQKKATLDKITGTVKLVDLKDCDLIIEAIIENIDIKKQVFKELDGLCRPEVIFGSNTSSISIIDMASATSRPDKFLGLHFFNPVPIMKLVEIVRSIVTSDETYNTAKAFCESLGKQIITAKDTPGFIVNLLLIPYLLDGVRAYESGVATREDIDAGMKLGCNMPMGPLELLDFVGVDTTLFIADVMYDEFRDPKYAAPPLLRKMVLAGFHGRKSGKGFYDYGK